MMIILDRVMLPNSLYLTVLECHFGFKYTGISLRLVLVSAQDEPHQGLSTSYLCWNNKCIHYLYKDNTAGISVFNMQYVTVVQSVTIDDTIQVSYTVVNHTTNV